MKKIAIPVFENRISNRLDCSENIFLYSVENNKVDHYERVYVDQTSHQAKLNLLIDLGIDVLICNGITNFYFSKLTDRKIQIIPWVSGEVQTVINQFLEGKLSSTEKI